MNAVAILSLIVLILVIAVAWKTKVSPGILGVAGAFLIGFFVVIDGAAVSTAAGGCGEILAAFPYKLIARIMFTALFFVTISQNGTLEILTGKLIRISRGNARLYPVIIFVITAALQSLGVDSFTLTLILVPIACAVARECGQNVIIYVVAVWCAEYGFALTPVCYDYILAHGLAEENGFVLPAVNYYFRFAFLATLLFALYYVMFGAYKVKKSTGTMENTVKKMNKSQVLSTIFMIVFIVVALMGFEVSVVAATLACLLMLFTKADQKKVIADMPWSTLILLIGMTMCIKMVGYAGGVDLLVNFFKMFMSNRTTAAIITLISGLMSTVSSATGVVQPTIAATAKGLSETYGVEAGMLLMCSSIGSVATSISPFSTLGGMSIGAAPEECNENNAMFNKLLLVAVINLVAAVAYVFIGGLNTF